MISERWGQPGAIVFLLAVTLSLGLVGLIKVIFLHLIFIVQPHLFQSFPVQGRKKGRATAERGESSAARRMSLQSLCHLTAVFTVVYRGERDACWDGTVVSQLKPFGGRIFRRMKNARAPFSSPHLRDPPCLLTCFRRPRFYYCFLSFFLFFLTPFGFSYIFPIFILLWRGLKMFTGEGKIGEKSRTSHLAPCPHWLPASSSFIFFMSNVTLKTKHPAVGGVKLDSISTLYDITSDWFFD